MHASEIFTLHSGSDINKAKSIDGKRLKALKERLWHKEEENMVREKRNMKLRDKMVIIQMRDRKGQKGVEVVVGESRVAKCASSVSSSWEESLMMILLLVSLSWEEPSPSLMTSLGLLVISYRLR